MAEQQQEAAQKKPEYTISRRDRHWEVRDAGGELVCLTVYRRGAREVVRRLSACRRAELANAPVAAERGLPWLPS